MKKFERPRTAVFNEDQSITLYFNFDEENREYPQGDFDIRGGICFPMEFRDEHDNIDVLGFAILVGFDLDKKIFLVFEEQPFIVVDSILNSEGLIQHRGIASWLNMAWSKYYCRKYYWHQDPGTVKGYRLEVGRSRMVKPKPTFIEIPWGENSDARHVVWKNIKANNLRYRKEGELYRQLELTKKNKEGKNLKYPAVHALQCALMGMERFPFRRRVPDLHTFNVGLHD